MMTKLISKIDVKLVKSSLRMENLKKKELKEKTNSRIILAKSVRLEQEIKTMMRMSCNLLESKLDIDHLYVFLSV